MKIVPIFTTTEKFVKKYSIIFSLLVMFQGLFGGLSLSKTPKRLEEVRNKTYFKLITLFAIAFSATQDIELSILSVILFILFLYAIKTPEERKKGLMYI